MEMKMKGILLAMEKFSIPDENTGVINEGLSVQYLLIDNLNPVKEDNLHGVRILKGWLDVEIAKSIVNAPAFYEFTMKMAVNTSGKGKLDVKAMEYLGDIEISEKLNNVF